MARQRVPDPHGLIANVRARLNKKCAVRISPFCDYIIAMRMQGVPYKDVERWLVEQGQEYRISAATIWRNLKRTKMHVRLTRIEEKLEAHGSVINLDIIREMSQNILVQKERIDQMVRTEAERRKQPNFENYIDKRIRQEMALMTDMVSKLHNMSRNTGEEALEEIKKALAEMDEPESNVTADAAALIVDLILNDEISVGAEFLVPGSNTRH